MVVTSFGKLVHSDSLRVGGDKFDEAIVRYFKRQHGIVIGLMKFCDPEEFDYVMIKKAREAAGIPVTVVEIDRQMVQFEQARTNIETFRDMLTM